MEYKDFLYVTKDGIIICSYEGTLDPWMSSLWRMLNMIKPELLPNGPDVVIQDTMLIDQPKVQISYHNIENINSHFSTASGITNSVNSWLACNVLLATIMILNRVFMYISFVVFILPFI